MNRKGLTLIICNNPATQVMSPSLNISISQKPCLEINQVLNEKRDEEYFMT